MHNSPLLSIIVPVYNAENYLNKCLDSLLAQDFSDCEIILVDDGSTDSSGIICDQYASANPVFRCIHKPNGGHSSARKCGYEASCGQYISFVDSDDWVAPDMYSIMCQAIYDTGADIVLCDYTAVISDREEVCSTPFSPGFYDKNRLEKEVYPFMIYSGIYFKYGISPNFWNKIFRRELLKKHLFHVPNEVVVGEDALATYSCMLEASSVFFVNRALYYYRSNADSLSRRAVPVARLSENHKMFDTLQSVIDVSSYPHMRRQLDYYFVYQSLLTFVLVFKNIPPADPGFKSTFTSECNFPLIHKAFSHVSLREIAGIHNKLYALCIRHRLPWFFGFLLRH